jgi:uncharacterized protein YcfL
MKKIMLLLVIGLVSLTGCGSAKKDSAKPKATSVSSQRTTQSSTKQSSAETSTTVPSSSPTVKTSEVQTSELTQARLALYQAGFDSSAISDEQLLSYWQAAQAQQVDFVTYVKAQ